MSDSQEVYEALLRVVDHHHPKISDRGILTVMASHGRFESGQVNRAMQAAVENGDLVRVGNSLAPLDEDALLAAIEAEVESEDTDNQAIARCNDALAEVRG